MIQWKASFRVEQRDNEKLREQLAAGQAKVIAQQARIELYEQALLASWPKGAMGDAFDYWNAARGAITTPSDTSALEAYVAKAHSWFVEEIKHLQKELGKLRDKKMVQFNNEECWIFQGDGNDKLETLTCPVVIYPEMLEAIVKKAGEVMRERLQISNNQGWVTDELIRKLPAVTLEDLK